jgi:hypothetical protein
VRQPERIIAFVLAIAAALAAGLSAQTAEAVKKAAEGRDHLLAGRLDEALARFKDAQIDLPDAPELALDIGLALYKLGRFDEAASAFASATSAKDVKVEALARFHLGNTLFRQGNLEGALVALNGSLRLVPDDEDVKFNREIVVRHLKEAERQKKDEEKKHEIEKLLRECLTRETAIARGTRGVLHATGEEPPPMESVSELAADLDVAAESRPDSRPSAEDVARAGVALADAQKGALDLGAELLEKIRKEAESRPAAAAGGPPGGAPHGDPSQDPEKLAAMKEAEAALRSTALLPAHGHEETALRKLLDALNEFLDELTRIILEQGKAATATTKVASEAGIELELPDSQPAGAASKPAAAKKPETRPGALEPAPDPEKTAELAATEKALGGRTDAFAAGVEQMLQQMKGAETRAADSQKPTEGPKPKDVEEALTLLHKASGHLGGAAGELGAPRLQPAFDAELLALKELIEAKKKLSPPQKQQGDDQKKDDQQKDQKKEEEKKQGEEQKKDEKKLSPEEAQALLDRLKQQEKDWREKKNADKKAAKDPGVKKDW